MRNIKVMNDNLANKIAAGEIVTRPYAVVKELVENSIDANSKNITIRLNESGISKIQISDDGDGITKDDLPLSIKRHATSKVYNSEELLKISSLGFRGEALASIFAVSKLSIISKTDDGYAYKLKKTSEDSFVIEEASGNKGTTINVDSLFYNTPARYSGLTNVHYELALIVKYINSVSMIHTDIAFELYNNDSFIYNTTGNSNLSDVFGKVYDTNIASNMLSCSDKSTSFEVELYFSNAYVSKPRRNHIILCINNRLVKSYDIEKSVIEAYKNYLHTNQYPIALVKVNVSYDLIDVNIHPTKQEVKISLIEELTDMIQYNIKHKLRDVVYINKFENDINEDNIILNEEDCSNKEVQQSFNFEVDLNVKNKLENVKSNEEFASISKEEVFYEKEDELQLLEYVGNYLDTYLIFQNKNGLFLVDQHAAQERIRYELISNKFKTHNFNYQQLLAANVINLTADEMLLIKDKLHLFEQLGIILEEFGPNTIKIDSVDSYYFKANNLSADIKQIIEIVKNENTSFEKLFDKLAIMMACKSSIKANQYLDKVEAMHLLKELKTCKDKYTCPHGRPVIVNFSNYEIEKLFKRVF